jgi:RNA polymerase sigma-70 factor (family 1)
VLLETTHNEKDLLLQVAEGDRIAFRNLYTHYFPIVQQYISLFEPTGRNLDELTQDVFVRIWEKRERLAGVETFRNYLFLMTRNVVFNYFKALKVHQRVRELEEDEIGEAGNDPESELLFKQYYHIALKAIEKLPPGRRKVLKMSIEQGLSLDEIARELNISRSGVKKQLYAATSYIREYLQEHGEMSLLLFVFISLFEV